MAYHLASVLLLSTSLLGLAAANSTDISSICDSIASIFNALNDAMPVTARFDTIGNSMPGGSVTFVTASRPEKACVSYLDDMNPGRTIIRINIASSLVFKMPKFRDIESEVNVTASNALVELHYEAINETPEGGQSVELRPISTELREIGKVEIQYENGKTKDFTDMGEDTFRPVLMPIVNDFVQGSLHFTIDPASYEPASAAYDAFTTIFKAYMYNIHVGHQKSLKNKLNLNIRIN